MNNAGALPHNRDNQVLRPMDPDRARYYCQQLRALADLLAAGEPVAWIEWTRGVGSEARIEIIAVVGRLHLIDAEVAVHTRVQAQDDDYAIRVVPKPQGTARRRGQHGR